MEQALTPEQLIGQHPIAALSPEVALVFFALAVLISGAFFSEALQQRLLPFLVVMGCAISGAGVIALWGKNAVFGPPSIAIYSADNFSLFFKAIFLLNLAVTALVSGRFLSARSGDRHTVAGEYYGLLILSTIGMMMVASARDLLVIFLGIETLSIALYVLAGFARARLMSNEAALKYFLLGAFATGFLLYGIALTYFATGSTLLPTIAQNVASGRNAATGQQISQPILLLGMALMLIGLGFKAALVPFHQWTPDVYEGSPTPVTGFMAVGAKAAGFAAIIRVFPGAFGAASVAAQWDGLLLVVAVLTMTVGNVVALSQTSLKRMLAYSSIAHAGYILMGVLAMGRANARLQFGATPDLSSAASEAGASVLFYLLVYAVMNLGVFATLVHLENRRAEERGDLDTEDGNISLDHLRGLAWREPGAALALSVFLLSLAGIPPLAGFFGKLFVFQAVVQQGAIGLAIVGALNSVISAYYYLRPVIEMARPAEDGQTLASTPLGADNLQVGAGGAATLSARPAVSWLVSAAIALCVLGVLAMAGLQTLALPLAREASSATASAGTVNRGTLDGMGLSDPPPMR